MVLDNINCSEVIHNKLKKCEFCGKELAPIGLDYLYANISPDAIKYERCDCNKAQEYWKKIDEQEDFCGRGGGSVLYDMAARGFCQTGFVRDSL